MTKMDKKLEFLQDMPAFIHIKNSELTYSICNTNFSNLLELNSSLDITNKHDRDFFTQSTTESIHATDKQAIHENKEIVVTETLSLKTGKTILVKSSKKPIYDNNGKINGLITMTQRIDEQSTIRPDSDKNSTILDHIINLIPGSIYWKDTNGIYLGCNQFVVKMAGVDSIDDVIGKSDYDFLWSDIADRLKETDQGIMKSRKPLTLKEETKIADGSTKILLTTKTPLFDSNSQVFAILGVSIDMTEFDKQQEELLRTKEALLESKLRENRYLKALSSLGAMIAHELRTPLSGIKIGLGNLEDDINELFSEKNINLTNAQKDEIEHQIKRLFRSVKYADTTISMILSGFHNTALNSTSFKQFSVKNVIDDVVEQYPFTPEERDLVSLADTKKYKAYGDPNILSNVLVNLIKNALQAIASANRGTISISTKESNQNVTLLIKDTATGISPDVLEHIFDSFFTTKEESSVSIGLGLYFSRLSLEKMNSNIRCESKYGEYTLFIIELPKNQAQIYN